jgi:hypothetical protein
LGDEIKISDRVENESAAGMVIPARIADEPERDLTTQKWAYRPGIATKYCENPVAGLRIC